MESKIFLDSPTMVECQNKPLTNLLYLTLTLTLRKTIQCDLLMIKVEGVGKNCIWTSLMFPKKYTNFEKVVICPPALKFVLQALGKARKWGMVWEKGDQEFFWWRKWILLMNTDFENAFPKRQFEANRWSQNQEYSPTMVEYLVENFLGDELSDRKEG